MKCKAIQLVQENQGGAIISLVIVVGIAMYPAAHKRKYRRSGSSPDINAQVKSSWFRTGVKMIARRINNPQFSVATNTIPCTCFFKFLLNVHAEPIDITVSCGLKTFI